VLTASSAVFGLVMPNHAGGSLWAHLASLGLIVGSCWYVSDRLRGDRSIPARWKFLLYLLAVVSIVIAARASVDMRLHISWWRAYGEVPKEILTPFLPVGAYTVMRACAWLDHRHSVNKKSEP
jgi:hypothetical protein